MNHDATTITTKSGNVWRYQRCGASRHPMGHTRGWVRALDGLVGSALAHPDGLEHYDRKPVRLGAA